MAATPHGHRLHPPLFELLMARSGPDRLRFLAAGSIMSGMAGVRAGTRTKSTKDSIVPPRTLDPPSGRKCGSSTSGWEATTARFPITVVCRHRSTPGKVSVV